MDCTTQTRNITVGITAVLALVLLGLMYWYVGALRWSAKTYEIRVIFNDIQGMEQGTPVMMAGVKIGRVERVSLTVANKAMVDLSIDQGYDIPIGSQVRIASVSLLGDKYVEILPGPPGSAKIHSGKTLIGAPSYNFADLQTQVSQVLTRLDQVGASAQSLLSDQTLRKGISDTSQNLSMASKSALGLINDLRGITAENRGEIDEISRNLADATANMSSAGAQIASFLQGARKEDIQSVMSDLKVATHNLDTASSNVAALTGDKKIKEGLEQSIENVRATTENARQIVEHVGQVLGVKKQTGAPSPAARPTEKPPSGTGPTIDLLYDSQRGKTRIDANYTLQLNGDTFYRAGIYDLGETPRVNLQAGRVVKPGQAFRYGLYQSRVGLGYDWQASKRWMLQGDVYRPNDPRLDIKGLYDIQPGLGGWLGFEGVGGSGSAVAGLQFKY